jgi:hypothetical protein
MIAKVRRRKVSYRWSGMAATVEGKPTIIASVAGKAEHRPWMAVSK